VAGSLQVNCVVMIDAVATTISISIHHSSISSFMINERMQRACTLSVYDTYNNGGHVCAASGVPKAWYERMHISIGLSSDFIRM